MKRNNLKYYMGAVLSRMFPELTTLVRQSFTLPHVDQRFGRGRIPRLIRYYVGEQAKQDPGSLESLHREFWRRQKPEGWYTRTANRFRHVSLPLLSDLVPRCIPSIQERQIIRVCEFGCGDGQWLDFLSEQWAEPVEFIGLDLAEEQIRRNLKRYPKLTFECADMTQWVRNSSSPNTIFVSFCGVLEYLSEQTLSHMLRDIVDRSPNSLLFLIEPLEKDFDLARRFESAPRGAEFSYSHNYPKLLEDAGLSVRFQIEVQEAAPWSGYRMLAILASTP